MTDYDEDYYYGAGPNHSHYYMPPENTFEYMPVGAPYPGPHPHMGAPYPMAPPPGPPPGPHHMGQYMGQHQRQPSYGARYEMGMGYYVPMVFEPTPEPEPEQKGPGPATKEQAPKEESKKAGQSSTGYTDSVLATTTSETPNEKHKNDAKDAKKQTQADESKDTAETSQDLESDSKSVENESNYKSQSESDKLASKLAQKELVKQQKLEHQQRQKDATIDYIQGVFASKTLTDTTLTINSVSVPVHAIFAARSKVLGDKLTNNQSDGLKLTVIDPGNWINEAAVNCVVATLYGLPLPSQMRQGQWFGAFLVSEALGLGHVSVEIETALKKQLVTTQATITALNSIVQRCLQGGKGFASNSSSLPDQLINQKQSRELSALFSFLMACLGSLTQSTVSELSTSSIIKSPFALYKVIMETSELLEGNTMEKYSLAKKLIQPRQKSHPGYQDVAVLAFSSDKDGLEIRRKKM
ncbi:hypothetical protein B0I72DRAFT_140946 [Yarrowia lipolytica]|nr:hypothetical protein B0I72DRAFT_140946 [Yarrowia lipolytica]RDW37398.1 hypothetical protein B0I73DRAFT_135559 [Yarrowia lipolytica]RDW45326.1 hypothetical protein B0I74DRAFT_138967 [Yarrowia lipolytica]RDW52783.1 hypothetical protein B0I75DRAFT_137528 [Yarrowia lipolytica]